MQQAFYNEIDPYAAEWLRNLMDAGHIPAGDVDERSIADVDGVEANQVHLFAGIGGWPVALRLAGWPDDRPVWTGSCPCQPFSAAGKRKGTADERHLWPEMLRLIRQCRPPVVFGEQVASKGGREWLAGVRADLEALGYAVGAADLCAAGVGSPHIRQRLFWVAEWHKRERCVPACPRDSRATVGLGITDSTGPQPGRTSAEAARYGSAVVSDGGADGLADAGHSVERPGYGRTGKLEEAKRSESSINATAGGVDVGLGDTANTGPQRRRAMPERADELLAWQAGVVIPCHDGKHRRISAQPGDEPLAYGIPRDVGPLLSGMGAVDRSAIKAARRNRTGRLKGYGNAIVPQVAAEFVRAFLEAVE